MLLGVDLPQGSTAVRVLNFEKHLYNRTRGGASTPAHGSLFGLTTFMSPGPFSS